jgi:hypothetical protein
MDNSQACSGYSTTFASSPNVSFLVEFNEEYLDRLFITVCINVWTVVINIRTCVIVDIPQAVILQGSD